MSNGHRGRRAEWRSRAYLEAQGLTVVRAAGSRGAFDLVAIDGERVLLVQVKASRRGSGPAPAERERLQAFACPASCTKLVHVWRPRARTPEVGLVRKADISEVKHETTDRDE